MSKEDCGWFFHCKSYFYNLEVCEYVGVVDTYMHTHFPDSGQSRLVSVRPTRRSRTCVILTQPWNIFLYQRILQP